VRRRSTWAPLRVDRHAAAPAESIVPIGDAFALAERLLGHAGVGELLVSPQAARRIEASCELRPATLRVGETERLDAASCSAGARAARSRQPRPRRRFVGRARELEVAAERFDSAAAGEGQVALVVGEPGIGKSRLLAELRQQLADTPHRWLEGAVPPMRR
jgi:transcriptional regulator with AAA-type ATPase domain